MTIKNNQLEVSYTQAEKDKLAAIEAGAQVNDATASQAEAEAGLDNAKMMTSLRVAEAIAAQVGAGGGEANTVSNEGASGEGLFIQKAGVNFEFKKLIAGTGVTFGVGGDTLTLNASTGGLTDTDDLPEGSTNFYYTEARVNANASVAANTAKISADGSIATHSDVVLTSPSNGQILEYNGSNWVNVANSGGSGEANTASNLAGDEGIFTTKSGVDLPFKSLTAGTNVSLSSDANTITINSTGGGASAINDLSDVTISSPANGEVLTYNAGTWENAAAGAGSAAVVAGFITIPTAGSLSARIAAATGLPAGWSLVLGNDGSVDSGLTSVGAAAIDIVIITNEGKSPSSVKVMKDFGGLVRQQVTYSPATGDILESNNYNQILLKDPENGTKAGTGQFEIVVVIPA